jgi:hypothetical protein
MIGMDRSTGKTLLGWEQMVSRVAQVMTTQIGSREKRRGFGSRVPETLSKNTSNQLLILAQSYALDAFFNPVNCISDFTPTRCVASRHDSGIKLAFWGTWNSEPITFEVNV